jgi:hypothetical protein
VSLDPASAERQRRRLATCINIAQAVKGPSEENVSEAVDGADPLLSIFFRPTPGPSSLVARRGAARRATSSPPCTAGHKQALRLYHAIGALEEFDAIARV